MDNIADIDKIKKLDLNTILNRNHIATKIKNILEEFSNNKTDFSLKRGLYIYGAPGIGKTQFITNILKEMNYDVIKYDAGDIRNKSIIDTITKHNMADKNILSLFSQNAKSIAIIMDEIDGMNNGDKGGINSLIKIIRQKKTKKQKNEEISFNPIICISNYHIDKKIKELMKVCNSFELKSPTSSQINIIINKLFPKIDTNKEFNMNIINFIQGDLRKLFSIYNLDKNDRNILSNGVFENIFKSKSLNEDAKEITKNLMHRKYNIEEHKTLMNETDRTIVGLLFHENIVDNFHSLSNKDSINLYIKMLNNICFADYMDRITFQKQIWQFNEMSSLMKVFYNNKIFHDSINEIKNQTQNQNTELYSDRVIRFTKILTKYSTEYNNLLFIQNLCQELNFDKKDMFAFFLELKKNMTDEEIGILFESYEISKLDINRIYRYLDKYNMEFIDTIDKTECSDIIDNNFKIDEEKSIEDY